MFQGIFSWENSFMNYKGYYVYLNARLIVDVGRFRTGEMFDLVYFNPNTLILKFFRDDFLVLKTRMNYEIEVI